MPDDTEKGLSIQQQLMKQIWMRELNARNIVRMQLKNSLNNVTNLLVSSLFLALEREVFVNLFARQTKQTHQLMMPYALLRNQLLQAIGKQGVAERRLDAGTLKEVYMNQYANFVAEIRKQLLDEKRPELSTSSDASHVPALLIQQLQEETKKNNRLTIKLFDELKQTVEEFGASIGESQKEKLQQTIVAAEKDARKKLLLTLDVFDLLDFMHEALKKTEDATLTASVAELIDKSLALFAEHGLQEIEVLHKLLDEKVMESIGAISEAEAGGTVPRYHVVRVHQRGFRDTHSGQVVRKAKIISVL